MTTTEHCLTMKVVPFLAWLTHALFFTGHARSFDLQTSDQSIVKRQVVTVITGRAIGTVLRAFDTLRERHDVWWEWPPLYQAGLSQVGSVEGLGSA
ncbi:hypothetical protein DE146DRAFT_662936 [Phaeosphaeria sp. MPI-PUGE-AT-0046c]|nr:hypothetical protein DE146DRAFT_662936 [Phaeosphaeria sp. MPI-PUGE-AT-0046c]